MFAVVSATGHAVQVVGRAVARLFTLVRDDRLLEDTFPEHYRPTGQQAAAQASVTMSLTSLGQG